MSQMGADECDKRGTDAAASAQNFMLICVNLRHLRFRLRSFGDEWSSAFPAEKTPEPVRAARRAAWHEDRTIGDRN